MLSEHTRNLLDNIYYSITQRIEQKQVDHCVSYGLCQIIQEAQNSDSSQHTVKKEVQVSLKKKTSLRRLLTSRRTIFSIEQRSYETNPNDAVFGSDVIN